MFIHLIKWSSLACLKGLGLSQSVEIIRQQKATLGSWLWPPSFPSVNMTPFPVFGLELAPPAAQGCGFWDWNKTFALPSFQIAE